MNKKDIFQELIKNIKSIEKAKKLLNLSINQNIRDGKKDALTTNTKLYALLFSVWVEALLYKTIYLENSFDDNEIKEILKKKRLDIGQAFITCIKIAFTKTKIDKIIINEQKKEITDLIQKYAISPSKIRNKIAHGQWQTAINNQFTNINKEITKELNDIDCVTVDRWFNIYKLITQLIELLVQSPSKGFKTQYDTYLKKIHTNITKMESWSLDEKEKKIIKKSSYYKIDGNKR